MKLSNGAMKPSDSGIGWEMASWVIVLFLVWGSLRFIERDQLCFNYGDKRHKASLTVLGLGMHALQDFFSPWHTGFQRWNPSDVAATAAHLTQEPFQKIGDPGPIQATLYTAQYYETYKSLLKLPFVDRGHAVALIGGM